jgi:N-acetylneuraminate lyase
VSVSGDKIEGCLPALITPFSPDGSVNIGMVRKLVGYEIEQGCHGFFVCGTTGEGLLLTPEERGLVVRTVVEEAAGQVPIIAHVGAVSTDMAVQLAKDAEKAGATAVSSVPPIYYQVGLEGMIRHITAIVQATDLPTYYYHIPMLTNLNLTGDEIVEGFGGVKGLVGLKFSHTDLFLLWWIIEASGGRLRVFNGSDQMLFQALSTGAIGGVGSTYNYQMANIAAVFNAVKAGDLTKAQELQWKVNKVIQVMFRHGPGLNVEKAIMKLLGYDCGSTRGPLVPFPEEKVPVLRKDLEEIGFFDK